MRRTLLLIFLGSVWAGGLFGQSAVDVPHPEEKEKAKRAVAKQQEKRAQGANIEFRGASAFSEKELRSQLKEQLTTVQELGLTAARAEEVAFYLELFYRKLGYAKVAVRDKLSAGKQMRVYIIEGPLAAHGNIKLEGNTKLSGAKMVEYTVGQTRER